VLATLFGLGKLLWLWSSQFIDFRFLSVNTALQGFDVSLLVTRELGKGRSADVEFQENIIVLVLW
jgi:hypothetical protein